jgi:hypothetical protein
MEYLFGRSIETESPGWMGEYASIKSDGTLFSLKHYNTVCADITM